MARRSRGAGCLILALMIIVVGAVGAFVLLRYEGVVEPVPGQQRCVAHADDTSVALDLDQAHYASIIVGIAVRRGLPARAASIAIATVYQETGIRNLDYGDRDSVGLFQQRPSQGWGSQDELMDPYYSTGKFYDALIKVDGWESADINDVAQQIQISGHPEAYRQHEGKARAVASTLTGFSPAGFTCLEREENAGDPEDFLADLRRTFGKVKASDEGKIITIKAKKDERAWALAHYAIANSRDLGVVSVTVEDRQWRTGNVELPVWTEATTPGKENRVVVTLR